MHIPCNLSPTSLSSSVSFSVTGAQSQLTLAYNRERFLPGTVLVRALLVKVGLIGIFKTGMGKRSAGPLHGTRKHAKRLRRQEKAQQVTCKGA